MSVAERGCGGRASGRLGFTMVEMLAVLAIITILMNISAVAVGGAKRAAQRTRTRDTARQLVVAWTSYLMDERSFPDESKFKDKKGDYFQASAYNIGALLNTTYNSKGEPYTNSKIYFETSETECERSGKAPNFSYAGTGVLDDWKAPLLFTLDFDLDGKIENPLKQGEYVKSSALVLSKCGLSGTSENIRKKFIVEW